MKTTLIAVAATLAFSFAPAAHAQEPVPQVKVSKYVMTPGEFQAYASAYRLSNGQKVVFTHQDSNYFFVQVDSGKTMRMTPVSRSEFVTAAGARIIFRADGDEVGISNFERLPKAQATAANTLMVARR